VSHAFEVREGCSFDAATLWTGSEFPLDSLSQKSQCSVGIGGRNSASYARSREVALTGHPKLIGNL